MVFNFFLFRVLSNDPVGTLFRGRNLNDAQRAELRREFGLDGSTLDQFWAYLKQTATLNLGRSYATNAPVIDEIWSKAGATVALVGVSDGALRGVRDPDRHRRRVAAALARPTTRRRRSRWRTYSMPDFWAGMLLLSLFGVTLGWFPIGGLQDPTSDATGLALLGDQLRHMFLPALTLTIAYLGEYALVMRASLLDTMREDYLTLARAKGLRDIKVRNRHAVPNALLPVVTLAAINFGFILSGAIAVETIFSWPGLGSPPTRRSTGRTCRCCRACSFLQRVGDPLQLPRRPALRVPRPAGADADGAAATPTDPRRIAWSAGAARSPPPGTTCAATRRGWPG